MASFAVTAIQGFVTQISEWRLAKRKVDEGIKNAGAEDSHDVVPHAEYVERYHRRWNSTSSSSRQGSRPHTPSQQEKAQEQQHGQQERRKEDVHKAEEEEDLTIMLIEHALALERHARRLLETHLPNGSKAQIVLKADRNVQLRHLQLMESQSKDQNHEQAENPRSQALKSRSRSTGADSTTLVDEKASDASVDRTDRLRTEQQAQKDREDKMARLQIQTIENRDDDPDWISHPLDDDGTMEEIRRYRESFAAFLATGSRLRRLEGAEKFKAERRLMRADDEIEVDDVTPAGKERAPKNAAAEEPHGTVCVFFPSLSTSSHWLPLTASFRKELENQTKSWGARTRITRIRCRNQKIYTSIFWYTR